MEKTYHFKRINSDSYKDLILISKSAFNINPGLEYYKRKNDTVYFGEPHLGYIAYSEDGEPAAFYGVYAHPMIIDGVKYIAAQSGDTMTHKLHGGKGLFTTLAKMTYDLAKEKGIDFIFGFPNYNSYPGFVKKLSWTCPYNLKEFRSKIHTIPLAKLAKKISIFNSIYKYYVNGILSFYRADKKAFQNSVIQSGIGGVERSEAFINYKIFSGSRIISIDGLQIWLKIDGFMFIGDIEKVESTDYSGTWRKLKKLCFLLGVDTLIFQVCPDVFYDKALSVFLPSTEVFPMGYLNLSGKIDPAKFKYVFGDIDTF